jgi:hypothetical protein
VKLYWLEVERSTAGLIRAGLPPLIVARYGHGYYTLRVDFSWAVSSYNASASSRVSWTPNYCTL